MHSVKEITNECQRLLDICNEITDRVDVHYAKTELLKSVEAMNSEFDKDSFSEELVSEYKTVCNKTAIYTEYVLSRFDAQLRRRYLDRAEVASVFERVDSVIRSESSSNERNADFLVDMLYKYSKMSSLLNESREVLFNLTDDDREVINSIRLDLDNLPNKQHEEVVYVS